MLASSLDIARGVAVIDDSTSDSAIEQLHHQGVRGARIMDLPGGAVDLRYLHIVDAKAANANWMLAIQFDGCEIEQYEEKLRRLRSPWVFDHHGKFLSGAKPDGKEMACLKRLLDRGNCWFKFAGCYESSQVGAPDFSDVAAFAKAVAKYAPERIIWGTNFPHNMVQSSDDYPNDAVLLDTVLSWLPDDSARQLALVDNPRTLFGFD